MRPSLRAVSLLLVSLAFFACGGSRQSQPTPHTAEVSSEESDVPVVESPEEEVEIRHVILVIGDGMGPQQIGLLEEYANRAPQSIYAGDPTNMSRIIDMSSVALSLTAPPDGLVVDSACSASQLATGQASPGEAIGSDFDGNAAQTVLELAQSRGWATGLVSDTRLTHATPASFAAHAAHRSLENEIAAQMLATGPDVMLSGGLRHWLPAATGSDEAIDEALRTMGVPESMLSSRRDDERNLLSEAHEAGYSLVFDRDALEASSSNQLLGLFASSGMLDGIADHRTRDDSARTQPTLAQMTDAAIARLSRDSDGFFLMVEGGQIDWAGHLNDAGRLLHEMVKIDEALGVILDFAEGRDDTLVIITADHETGGFGFSYSRANLPDSRALPGELFTEREYQPNFNFGPVDVLDGLWNQQRSFIEIFDAFEDGEQTAERLVELVNMYSDFDIDIEGAERVLARGPNEYYVEGHSYLSSEEYPVVNDFSAYYCYGDDTHLDLLGRELATAQNVVWSTGTHTHTPVVVAAFGPGGAADRFTGLMHHVEVGATLMSVVAGQ